MAQSTSLENLAPPEIVEAALGRDQRGFLNLYGDTLLLLVRVGPEDAELASGLGSSAVRGREGMAPTPVGAMEFHTVIQPAAAMRGIIGNVSKREDASAVTRCIESAPHFAVPLRKRPGGDTTYKERISVGRARNKDVVLRHASVSKFHGWFEVDDVGRFHLTDAGSKNRTRVNGTPLVMRQRQHVDSGDAIHFGSVETVLCSPRALWAALQGAGRT